MSDMGGKGNWGETWDWSAKDFLVATAILGGRKKKQVSIGTSFEDALCALLRTVRFLCTGDGCGGRKRREANGSAESGRIVLAGGSEAIRLTSSDAMRGVRKSERTVLRYNDVEHDSFCQMNHARVDKIDS